MAKANKVASMATQYAKVVVKEAEKLDVCEILENESFLIIPEFEDSFEKLASEIESTATDFRKVFEEDDENWIFGTLAEIVQNKIDELLK